MQSKYRAVKTVVDGITFDSKAEARRYSELKILERAKQIENLVLQPKFELQAGFTHKGKRIQAINYIADFQYTDCVTGALVVEDVKGMRTKEFNIKYKMFLKRYPEIDFRVIK